MIAAFPPEVRLRRPGEFEAVLKGGTRVHEKLLTVAVRANALTTARIGFAISARAVPRAVDRNRIKRQARESFRAQRISLQPADLVVLARSGVSQASKAELRVALERVWQKLRSR